MTDPRRMMTLTMTVLIVLMMVMTLFESASSSSSYYTYGGNFPVVFFSDFKYVPTDYGYKLSYRTQAGVIHEELGIVPGVPPLRGDTNNDDLNSNPDTLGSSRGAGAGRRPKSKRLPTKTRKVSPKLLASLSG
ncbi:uncharacterized protein LOC129947418 [Eupeodes corollae]|uniref:uncharacterized protein LOC129947418 n=1 Tax=Eupeodes corollae TaxID=290404 RepID=UPI00248FCD53|nr:uncharacterized protein LOC129947418 [Eupeodes corollae]